MFRFSGPGLSEDYNAAMDEREKLMTLKAGNTVESMKPKEACTIPCNCAYEAPPCPVHGDQRNAPPNPELICPDIDECAPVINAGPDLLLDVHSGKMNEKFREIVSRESNKMFPQIGEQEHWDIQPPIRDPQLDAAPQFEKYNNVVVDPDLAAQIEEIPPTNLWSLRWRINELEKRVDELTDRIALFNVRSGQKL